MEQQTQPFAPPLSDVALNEPLPMDLASTGARFGTCLVDYVGFMVCSAAFGIVMGLVFGASAMVMLSKVPDFVMGAVFFLGYYVFFEGIWGRTPGKWLFRTVVVDEHGGKPSIGQVLGRSLARFIPFEPLSFFGTLGWHDSLSKTRVVRAPRRG